MCRCLRGARGGNCQGCHPWRRRCTMARGSCRPFCPHLVARHPKPRSSCRQSGVTLQRDSAQTVPAHISALLSAMHHSSIPKIGVCIWLVVCPWTCGRPPSCAACSCAPRPAVQNLLILHAFRTGLSRGHRWALVHIRAAERPAREWARKQRRRRLSRRRRAACAFHWRTC